MSQSLPPANDQLELSLFGPGVGECIAMHLGGGDWIVVDSCLDKSRKPVALSYFSQIGVNPATQVKHVVVTHWHDDHIKGLGELFLNADQAELSFSGALMSEEFFALVKADEDIHLAGLSSGAREVGWLLELQEKRHATNGRVGPDNWLSCGKILYASNSLGVSVQALSPSAQTLTDAFGELAKLMPKAGEPIRSFRSIAPNDTSIALLVTAPNFSLLLGGDLEAGSDVRRGWRAAISSSQRPAVKSDVFKVAHHGSKGADIDILWPALLVNGPIAVLTPYTALKNPLPTNDDVKRILGKSQAAYCTSNPKGPPVPRRRGADQAANRVTKKRRRALGNVPGQIRIRLPLSGSSAELQVECFDGAFQLAAPVERKRKRTG